MTRTARPCLPSLPKPPAPGGNCPRRPSCAPRTTSPGPSPPPCPVARHWRSTPPSTSTRRCRPGRRPERRRSAWSVRSPLTGGDGWTQITVPFVATPGLLAHYGIAPRSCARRRAQRARRSRRRAGRVGSRPRVPRRDSAAIRTAAELHLGAEHRDHRAGRARRPLRRGARRLAAAGACANHRLRRSRTPVIGRPAPESPSRQGPDPTARCSTCATTPHLPDCWWPSACSR